jgi:hypothetical protein
MMSAQEILNEWFTDVDTNNPMYIKALERFNICLGCPNKKETGVDHFYYCDGCGCSLRNKVLTQNDNGCPLNKW